MARRERTEDTVLARGAALAEHTSGCMQHTSEAP
jgi:hypothetical protein